MLLLIKIAFKHIWSTHKFKFINFSSTFSIIGLIIGISSLIIISSISEGFNDNVNLKLSAIDGHIRINNIYTNTFDSLDANNIIDSISQYDSLIKYRTKYIEHHAILRKGDNSAGVIIYGISSKALDDIFNINMFNRGSNIFKSKNSVFIGKKLAEKLDITIGQELILFDPSVIMKNNIFKARKVVVDNIFNTDFPEYDLILVFMPINTVNNYFEYNDFISGIILNIDNQNNLDNLNYLINRKFENTQYMSTTWKDRHSGILYWLNIYDMPIKIIMFFITLIAIFNIGATLWMVVIDKSREYGLLKAFGLSNKQILLIIVFQGAIIGFFGAILSMIFSFIILYAENTYHFIQLSSDIYFTEYLPINILPRYFIIYPALSIILTIILSYIPARRALSINPSELLLYE